MASDAITPAPRVTLDPGVYTNIFEVTLTEDEARFVVAPRASFRDLRALRQSCSDEGWNVQLYAPSESGQIYGYGPDLDWLASYGFYEEFTQLLDAPRLVTRLIIDGISILLQEEGCDIAFRKGHVQVYRSDQFKPAAGGKINVFRGYDLRSIFWFDPAAETLKFGLVVDVTWALRDQAGQSVNMRQVGQIQAAREIAQLQGEYLPGGDRINTEVARQRLRDHIMPFVQRHSSIRLPCGTSAKLIPEPLRVVLGGDER